MYVAAGMVREELQSSGDSINTSSSGSIVSTESGEVRFQAGGSHPPYMKVLGAAPVALISMYAAASAVSELSPLMATASIWTMLVNPPSREALAV